MKILIVNPRSSTGFQDYSKLLSLVFKKALFPPLGLLTAAAVLPDEWQKKFVDLNVRPLKKSEILWADYIFLGGILNQQDSAREIISTVKKLNKKIIAGGSFLTRVFTFYEDYGPLPEEFSMVDHCVLGEAEITLKEFVNDLKSGKTKRIYTTSRKADLKGSPVPLWDIVNLNDYFRISIQFSKGCSFGCDFCDIGFIDGDKYRTKNVEQIFKEFELIFNKGWKGEIFITNDNFTLDKSFLKKEFLPLLKKWSEARGNPFTFSCVATTDISNDTELLGLLNKVGFISIFLGIETTNKDSLAEFTKVKNLNVDLEESMMKIQRSGLSIHGGFILGFDNDDNSTVDGLIDFIIKNGIASILLFTLVALPGTKLYHKMKKEGRLLDDHKVGSVDFLKGETNFIPKMGYDNVKKGFKRILIEINSPKNFKKRILKYMEKLTITPRLKLEFNVKTVLILANIILTIGFLDKRSRVYRKMFLEFNRDHPDRKDIIISSILLWSNFINVYEDQFGPFPDTRE